MGSLIDRTQREMSDEEIARIAAAYHAWRGCVRTDGNPPQYEDVPCFSKSATTDEIKDHSYVLTPGRYVDAAEVKDDGVPFEEKMERLMAQLREQFVKADQLKAVIKKNLEILGYGE